MPSVPEGHFALSVAKWVHKAKGNEDKVLRAVCLSMLNELVLRSPVGNPDLWKHPPPPGYVGGRFRANWQVSVDKPAEGDRDVVDRTGAVSIAAGQAVLAGVVCGPPVFIVNNLPYALPLEFGHSTQAPLGMVGLTQLRFHNIVEVEARKLR